MALQQVKRWQWILASLLIGVIIGYVQRLGAGSWEKDFGETLTQQQFEEGLVREYKGQRWLRDIVIYPEKVEVAGNRVTLEVVTCNYFNGKMEWQNGQPVAVWHPRCYIAEEPYTPINPKMRQNAPPTVISYLNRVKGINYTYAWWHTSAGTIAVWTAASFGVIGLIWPTIINLTVFGTFVRPKESRGIDLSNVQNHGPASGSTSPETDLNSVAKVADAIEAQLQPQASSRTVENQIGAAAPPVPQLNAGTLEVATPQTHEVTSFGKDSDDFYPTQRKSKPVAGH